ncbi:CxxC motif-containing protein [Caloramator quimbayensis]|uniref:CxxC motif-containing protein n=1 Tax=Caloramator quimbayensis TaxID=1147123 RepID=A0A1T4YGB0_9CLOT|nr:DUF1667 domain-containing protein [Caloramator quimbayensis]SKB00809.1 CxxC motif-containing protein [Caloramator quimbayensis]
MEEFTCIICPNGCKIKVEKIEDGFKVEGNICKRGYEFAINEMTNPKRSLCTTVKTSYKDFPRLPVKTDREIPKDMIFKVMEEINKINLTHMVKSNDIIIENVLGTGANIVSTCDMELIFKEE